MKRFHELTKEQQDQAIAFARNELKENPFIEQGDPKRVDEFAQMAAEESFYSEKGDAIIADIADGK
jgi:hypothetical protein